MKKTILIAMLFLGTTVSAQIKALEVTPLIGYTLSGSISDYYGFYDVNDGMSFGGQLGVEVYDKSHVEISYKRSHVDVRYDDAFIGTGVFDLGIEHYQIGIVQEVLNNDKIKPFGMISLGTTRYWERNDHRSESWRFSATCGLGAKFFLNKIIGLRVQTQLIIPMSYAAGGLFCGFGTGGAGCSAGVAFEVPVMHWDFSGGLIIRIPTAHEE